MIPADGSRIGRRGDAKNYIVEDRGHATPCWIWVRSLDGSGYAQTHVGQRTVSAHKLNYELARGPVPEGLQLDHLCRQTACINPDHLEPVTAAENQRRSPQAKLTEAAVREILASSATQVQLAARFGVSRGLISHVLSGRSWKDLHAERRQA